MKISDIRMRRMTNDTKMKAVVSITIDEEFVIHDIKVIEGEKGLFIAMPSRKSADGEYRDIAHPIKSETRTMLQNLILDEYQKEEEAAEELTAVYRKAFSSDWRNSWAPSIRPFWKAMKRRPEEGSGSIRSRQLQKK